MIPKKPWFKTRNLGQKIIGVEARGFHQKDEKEFRLLLTYMTGSSPRKTAKKLVDALNAVVTQHYEGKL